MKFQRLELKLGKLDLDFLSTCKKRSVMPRFLSFKVANRRLRASSAYRQWQTKLLRDEINAKHARIRILSAQVTTAHFNLASLVSNMDFNYFNHLKMFLTVRIQRDRVSTRSLKTERFFASAL